MANDVAITPGAGATVATDEAGGRHFQLVKLVGGVEDGTERIGGDATYGLDVDPARAGTAAVTAIDASDAAVQLAAASGNRLGLLVLNDGNAPLYLKYGTGADHWTHSYTAVVAPGALWAMPPPAYTGVVSGIWKAPDPAVNRYDSFAPGVSGWAIVTEISA